MGELRFKVGDRVLLHGDDEEYTIDEIDPLESDPYPYMIVGGGHYDWVGEREIKPAHDVVTDQQDPATFEAKRLTYATEEDREATEGVDYASEDDRTAIHITNITGAGCTVTPTPKWDNRPVTAKEVLANWDAAAKSLMVPPEMHPSLDLLASAEMATTVARAKEVMRRADEAVVQRWMYGLPGFTVTMDGVTYRATNFATVDRRHRGEGHPTIDGDHTYLQSSIAGCTIQASTGLPSRDLCADLSCGGRLLSDYTPRLGLHRACEVCGEVTS